MKTDTTWALERLPQRRPRAGMGLADRTALHLVLRLARQIRHGSVILHLPDGRTFRWSGTEPGPQAELRIHDPRVLRRLIGAGYMGLAEAYLDGLWDTPDLVAVMALGVRNQEALLGHFRGNRLTRAVNRLYHRLRPNSRRGSRRNIAAHYDLGNAFYAAWLDPGMTYSSARFTHPGQSLVEGQEAKYRRIGELAGLAPGQRVLEIGCGWGGFMEHAARLGCRVEGITLSREQLAYVEGRMAAAGLRASATASLTDYRDTSGTYDALVSIEMVEAVGEAHWPRYFATLAERLAPGGAAVLQAITIADRHFDGYRRHTDFIQRYVFPGGMLPSPAVLHREAAAAGLVLDHQETFGADYARTLAEWRERFHAAWPGIQHLGLGARFGRLWSYYLCYCEAGFCEGTIDVGIYRLRKPVAGAAGSRT